MRISNLFTIGLVLTTWLVLPKNSVAAEEQKVPVLIVSHCMKAKSQDWVFVMVAKCFQTLKH